MSQPKSTDFTEDRSSDTKRVIQQHYDHVRVGVRLAQITAEELNAQAERTIEVKSPDTLIAYYPESGEGLLYQFDFVFEQRTPFDDVFKRVGLPAVNCLLEGYNSSIISYGPSRTGKTELLYGNDEETGLITNCLREAFTYFANAPDHIVYTVVFSYWEMNKDEVLDLLNPKPKDSTIKYRVRKHPDHGVFITNLSEVEIRSWDELEELIDGGTIISQKASNSRGTRWHSFLKLTLVREDARHPELTLKSSLMFCNLKGSDRVGQLGAKGKLLREGAALNQSMTALGNAIHNVVSHTRKKLQDAKNNQDAIELKKKFPNEVYGMFGDTKVTSVLSEALSGNYCTSIVCSVSPTEFHYLETMEALENIRIASHIPCYPQRGDVKTQASILFKKIQKLKQSVSSQTQFDRPLTEKEEQLKHLQEEFDRIVQEKHGHQDHQDHQDHQQRLSRQSEDALRKQPSKRIQLENERASEPIPMSVPQDAHIRLWKQSDVVAAKHGTRKTFFFPKQKGPKKTYQGQWSNNLKSGQGTLETTKSKYSGGWNKDKRSGYGILWIKQKPKKKKVQPAENMKRIYAGEWKNDLKHGKGVYYYDNGDVYDGEWRGDKRHGKGILYYSDGRRYEGEWQSDKEHGFGIFFEVNNDRYEGQHFDGKRHGEGIYYYVSKGRLYRGEWIDGKARCGEIEEYDDSTDGQTSLPIPTIELRNARGVLDDMKRQLREEWLEKNAHVNTQESIADSNSMAEDEFQEGYQDFEQEDHALENYRFGHDGEYDDAYDDAASY